MKRVGLIRHLEHHGCEFLREESRDIVRSMIFPQEKSVQSCRFPSHSVSANFHIAEPRP